ncbi:MAG: hypothetical protein MHM6MM_002687 [Cercozoa sp. M6MM]
MDSQRDILMKVVIVGDAGVGKSALLNRFGNGAFDPSYISTIGVDFLVKVVTPKSSPSGQQVKLQLWDTAGQERFRAITRAYYSGAHAIVVCFDLNAYDSFEHVTRWVQEVRRHNATGQLLLCGTKSDQSKRVVPAADIEALQHERLREEVKYFETSSLTGDGVDDMFNHAIEEYVRRREEMLQKQQEQQGTVDLNSGNSNTWCCGS